MSIVKASGAVVVVSFLTGVSGALAQAPVPSNPRAGVAAAAPRAESHPPGDAPPTAPENPYVPPACSGVFTDVACPGGFAVNWIEKFYADGITSGCSAAPLQYCPDASVTRAQMAVFVEKAMRGTTGWTPGDLGNFNTAIGASSLPYSTMAGGNTAVGYSSLAVNTLGYENTGVGDATLSANSAGYDNTAVGAASLYSNTTGYSNTAVGDNSLGANTKASRNTAVGVAALGSQSYDPGGPWESNNTAVGANALYGNQPDGGHSNLNGTQNVAVGAEALAGNTTGYRNTAVGYQAGARGDQVTTYAGGTVNLVAVQTGSYNTFVGMAGATTQVDNCTAVGQDAYCDATNEVRLGNYFVSSIGGKVAWSALSDARAKDDIRDLDMGLDFVLALRPVAFRYKGGNGRTDMGFVAQDVEALVGDDYNLLGIGGDKDRTLSLRYTDLIAPLVKAVQEQQATIAAQQSTIESQAAQIEILKAQQERSAQQQSQVEALLARMAKLEAAVVPPQGRPQ